MNLTEKERMVMAYLQDTLDEQMDTIAYSEIASNLSIDSKQLRGVVASLLKKSSSHTITKKKQLCPLSGCK